MYKKKFCYLFYAISFLSLCYGLFINNDRIMFLSTFTILLYLLFDFILCKFNLKVSFLFKFFTFFFLFCSEILGEAYSFYSYYFWWDEFLHFMFGILIFYIGYCIFNSIVKNSSKKVFGWVLLFSFCFSLSVGVVWEFVEFGYDRIFIGDTQKDRLINKFNTTYFGLVTDIKDISKIQKTEIYTDDEIIVIDDGYLDIGLFDTICDLLFSSLGSLCYIAYIFCIKINFKKCFSLIFRRKNML